MNSDIYDQLAEKIIEQQESIIGPVAVEQAQLVSGMQVDWPNHKVSISGDAKAALDQLVGQYRVLFGQISVEVCKDAVSKFASQLQPDQLPKSLQ